MKTTYLIGFWTILYLNRYPLPNIYLLKFIIGGWNEEADKCARKGSEEELFGPELTCGFHTVWHEVYLSVGLKRTSEAQEDTDGQGHDKRML